jgi:hypothetical protein
LAVVRASRVTLSQPGELGQHLLGPLGGGLAVEQFAAVEQRAAHLLLLVGQDHPGAAAGRGQRRGQAGGAGADHQQVAVLVEVIVAVRVALHGAAAQARALADELLVGHPHGGRGHEGLVVEARRHEATAQLAHQTHDVALHVGPAVGAARHQAVEQRLLGGTHVGHLGRLGAAQLDQRIGLLGAGGDDAPSARVLEATVDDIHAVGQQRRGQGVAGMALVALAVEGEGQPACAIDAPALAETIRLIRRLAHALTPS